MTSKRAAFLNVFPATVVAIILCVATQSATAQAPPASSDPGIQQPAQQPGTASSASEAKTFTGKIVRDGDKVVLTDADGKKTYQLDDQQKATAFLNKTVKVTGVLDSASGVIRVNVIGPTA